MPTRFILPVLPKEPGFNKAFSCALVIKCSIVQSIHSGSQWTALYSRCLWISGRRFPDRFLRHLPYCRRQSAGKSDIREQVGTVKGGVERERSWRIELVNNYSVITSIRFCLLLLCLFFESFSIKGPLISPYPASHTAFSQFSPKTHGVEVLCLGCHSFAAIQRVGMPRCRHYDTPLGFSECIEHRRIAIVSYL